MYTKKLVLWFSAITITTVIAISLNAVPPTSTTGIHMPGVGIPILSSGVMLDHATSDSLTEGGTNLFFTDSRAVAAVTGKEPAVTIGTSAQYYRGDKTFQTLNTTAVAEGTNLYFTNARAIAAVTGKEPTITAGTTSQYWRGDKSFQTLDTSVVPENGNLYFTTARFNTAFASRDSGNLAEGSNLYYTQARSRSAISAVSPIAYNSTTGIISGVPGIFEPAISSGTTAQYWRGDKTFQTLNTSVVPESGNLYYTTARFTTDLATKTTANLTEGSNLYYTDTRARASITATAPITSTSGVIACNVASGSQPGCLSSANWTTFNNKLSALGATSIIPTRTVNSNFQPSSTKITFVKYMFEFSTTVSITTSQNASVELRCDTSATPTTKVDEISTSKTVLIGLSISLLDTSRSSVSALVPAGQFCRLVTGGTGTITLVGQRETTFDPS